jgi:uncharacterized protein with ParB-like and HNH nuclease domain
MDKNQNDPLILKTVGELFGYNFFIPDYQRGYRWTDTQVKQLLDDIWEFAVNPPKHEKGEENPFYCLQPIVVKKRKNNSDDWEVIDGQQRLTTLYLIIKNLELQIDSSKKNFEKISYQTRIAVEGSTGSEEFLKNVQLYEEQANENIDFFHIWKAYNTIKIWFKEKADNTQYKSPKPKLTPVLLEDTKVIWYEINDSGNDNNAIDIFTRLNIGKIPLTNAELIKALFLQKGNFSEEKASLKQIQIASEWDIIEKTLQDDAFWFFIYNPGNPLKYDNRIEYIFDIMKGRTKDSEYYHTFNKFYEEFSGNQKDKKPNIDGIWLEIKQYFLTFEEWFKDDELFHYIGYLVDCNIDIKKIKKESSKNTKKDFKEYLKSETKKQIKCDNIDLLEYKDKITKKVLLLFNIQTILQTQKSEMRFPFHKYKNDNWDIEHVRSQTEMSMNNNANKKAWIVDILEYFTGSQDPANDEIDELSSEENKNICIRLKDLCKSEKIDEELFKEVYDKISEIFKESKTPEDINNISNLALLDAATNRSYKNAFFPIKRKIIIDNDKNGIFVPICTKNLFLKYYSKKFEEAMYWNSKDAEDYLRAIRTTLEDFMPKKGKK